MHQAKTNLSGLVARVEQTGEPIYICRNGTPIVELSPIRKVKDPLQMHAELAGVIFHEDPMLPLDPEDWLEEGE